MADRSGAGRPLTTADHGTADVVIGGGNGPEVHLLEVGATVQRMVVTGGDGVRRDVALGLRGAAAARSGTAYVGSIVGRYANRIAHGHAVVGGSELRLPLNDRGHHLHGGPDGFHQRRWAVVDRAADAVTFELTSPDGDSGYPGELSVRARYRVTADRVELDIAATTTATTLVNLTSHVYLNLDGSGSVEDHLLQVPAGRYTPVDDSSIPTGDHADVRGTGFDLTAAQRIGDVVRQPDPGIRVARGLDHNYVIDAPGWRRVATLDSPAARTRMDLWSDQPGLQVYTGNSFDGTGRDLRGRPIGPRAAVALEPQLAPDSPNRPGWPSAVLEPGETYRSRMAWVFSALTG
ncbi:aldose epimerase family protein [Nocardioides sambongensis]|uniref:aldose epimerase family protein n=1 Tax=Nocardioides sambongensis TaxID=2589074 RepID=UPI0011269A24|nr:aldose epimerase family protein [Nocardioides sambongensis]